MSKTACFHVLIYVEGFYGKGGDLMLKKFISTLVLICVMTCCFSFNVFAETTVDDEIALMNLYTNKISTNITRSSSKKISYDCSVTGKSTATKITVYLYLLPLNLLSKSAYLYAQRPVDSDENAKSFSVILNARRESPLAQSKLALQ